MKPLKNLVLIDRGKLLHDLFPENISSFLDYAIDFATYMENNKEEIVDNWGEQLFSFENWLSYALDAKSRIGKCGSKMLKSSRLFADQLFDGYLAFWTTDVLCKYVSQKEFNEKKFKKMVEVLFCSD
jgi:hypothetical protein